MKKKFLGGSVSILGMSVFIMVMATLEGVLKGEEINVIKALALGWGLIAIAVAFFFIVWAMAWGAIKISGE